MPGLRLCGGNPLTGSPRKLSPHQPPAGGSFSPKGRSQRRFYLKG